MRHFPCQLEPKGPRELVSSQYFLYVEGHILLITKEGQGFYVIWGTQCTKIYQGIMHIPTTRVRVPGIRYPVTSLSKVISSTRVRFRRPPSKLVTWRKTHKANLLR